VKCLEKDVSPTSKDLREKRFRRVFAQYKGAAHVHEQKRGSNVGGGTIALKKKKKSKLGKEESSNKGRKQIPSGL